MNGQDELPMICDICLGDSTRVRLTKNQHGANCKICTLPYTVYQFKSDNRDVNLTKTLLCTKCAKQRNICQCCMLDMTWHISLQLRDRMLSMINGDKSMITEEVKNDMMRKFLALKGDELGGARITSDPKQIDLIMKKLQHILTSRASSATSASKLTSVPLSQEDTASTSKLEKFKSLDISHILRKLPLKESFELTTTSKSFFLYNVSSSLPEWRINRSISEILNVADWQDQSSNALIIHHKARCGALRFKNDDLGVKFVQALLDSGSYLKTSKGLQRGIMKIDHFQIFIIPWKSGFSTSSFGNSAGESIKLGSSLDRFLQIESDNNPTTESVATSKKNAGKNMTKGKVTKKKNKVMRVSGLDL